MNYKYLNKFSLFGKGFLMGVCDVLPGVSGGTIAFITGIYPELIKTIKKVFLTVCKPFLLLLKSNRKGDYILSEDYVNTSDFVFLALVGTGIATAFLAISKGIGFLLENYYPYTVSFFLGLIIISVKVIYGHIDRHSFSNLIFILLGAAVGVSLFFVVPIDSEPKYWYVFLGGVLAINAMLLPGISGAYILFIMGIYEFMINSLHLVKARITYILTFLGGAVIGAFTISMVVSYLFSRYKNKTLCFLIGLVLGSLIITVKSILREPFQENDYFWLFAAFLGGAGFVFLISNRKRERLDN